MSYCIFFRNVIILYIELQGVDIYHRHFHEPSVLSNISDYPTVLRSPGRVVKFSAMSSIFRLILSTVNKLRFV